MDDKRFYRDLKRRIKKAGNRSRRQFLKRSVAANPEEAHDAEFEFGRKSSAFLNGLDDPHSRPAPGSGG